MANSSLKIYKFKAGFGEAEVMALRDGVAVQMREAGIGSGSAYALTNILDEFCCNMMEHAQASWVEIEVEPRPHEIVAALRDDGVAFDPTAAISQIDPEQLANVAERRLGLYMIGVMA